MNLLDAILGDNAGVLSALGKNANLGETDVKNVLRQLMPAFSKGISKNISSEDGLGNLLGALDSGNHQRYLESPGELGQPATVNDGNSILGHIFGSKDVSRNVAAHAANQTGVSSGLIKKLLPLVASVAMGALSKQSSTAGILGQALNSAEGSGSSGALGMLTGFLDADNDGSVADDLLKLATKFF